jgi:hypothetical protein
MCKKNVLPTDFSGVATEHFGNVKLVFDCKFLEVSKGHESSCKTVHINTSRRLLENLASESQYSSLVG